MKSPPCFCTVRFLYGPGYTSHTETEPQGNEEEEELDEDDLEDVEEVKLSGGGGSGGAPARPSVAAPDYDTLRKETQMLELQVHGFYGGVCVLPEEVQAEAADEKTHTEVSKHNTHCLDLLTEIYGISKYETSPLLTCPHEGATYQGMRSS